MALTPTTPFVLDGLIRELIRGTTPRVSYQQASAWKPYEEQTSTASRSRRFRLVWEDGAVRTGGIFTNGAETVAPLRVRVDYVGEHQEIQFMREDDLHHLRDRISTLAEDSENGFVLIEPDGITMEYNFSANDVAAGRGVREGAANAGTWDLVYPIRYLRARG